MTLPNDVARCPGVSEMGAPDPIRLCINCARRQAIGTGGPRTPHIFPPAGLRQKGDGLAIYCETRIEAAPIKAT